MIKINISSAIMSEFSLKLTFPSYDKNKRIFLEYTEYLPTYTVYTF